MSDEIQGQAAPADRASVGPFDETEANPVRPYIDLGGIKVLPREGLNLRLEVEEQTKRIVAVGLDYADSTLQVQPFAAPRSSGLWEETREQIRQQIRQQGGRVEEREGPLGPELLAEVPVVAGPDAAPGKRLARFVGVDGPRWFLRGVIGGAATSDMDAAAKVEDLFRSIVVVRGGTPMPPRDLIPLKMPAAPRHGMTTPEESPRDRPGIVPPDAVEARQPTASELVGQALGGAARRAGMDPAQEAHTGHIVWAAMGGWRGVLESVLPGLAFVVLFTISQSLVLALAVSVGLAAVFTVVRLLQRSTVTAALGGLIAAAAAAALALWTGRAQDNFVPGLITNAAYGTAFLVSALIGWSLIGLAVGFLMNEGTAWRKDVRKRRAFFWLAIAWAALFFARLAVQLPLYLAGTPEATTMLGTLKLVMGLPLFAPLVAVTWLAVRAVYPKTGASTRA